MKDFRALHRRIRARALSKGVRFAMSRSALRRMLQSEHCPICNIRFIEEESHPHEISIDRIVPHLGYTDKNTIAICRTCNGTKADHGVESLRLKGLGYLASWTEQMCEQRSLPQRPTILMKIRRRIAYMLRKAADFFEV